MILLFLLALALAPVLGPLAYANILTSKYNLTGEWSYSIILLGLLFYNYFYITNWRHYDIRGKTETTRNWYLFTND